MTYTYATFIDARRAGENAIWDSADHLVEEWPRDDQGNLVYAVYDCTRADDVEEHKGNGCCIWQQQVDADITPWPLNTAKANRRVAEVFPPDTRVAGVSFSAHRMALRNSAKSDDIETQSKAGLNAIQAVLDSSDVDGNPALVSENRVRTIVQDLAPKGKGKGKGAPVTVTQAIDIVSSITVGTHLGGASDKVLGEWIAALESALSKATGHRDTRAERKGKGKSKSKSTPKSKSGKPAQARG